MKEKLENAMVELNFGLQGELPQYATRIAKLTSVAYQAGFHNGMELDLNPPRDNGDDACQYTDPYTKLRCFRIRRTHCEFHPFMEKPL